MPRSLRPLPLVGPLALALAAGCGDQVVGRFDPTGAPAGSSSASGSSGSPPGDASTSPPPSDSSGAALGPEQCNGLDDDGDGLVDEVSPELTTCDDCLLLQGVGQAWWICEEELSWWQTFERCQSLGAHVAVVPDEASQTFLHEQVGVGFHWLGAKRDEGGDSWSWIDGTPWVYDNWGTTQPDDIAPGQGCLRLTFGIVDENWFDGAWDDFFCDDPHPVTCSAPHALP